MAITIYHAGLFVLGVGGSIALTFLYMWLKEKKLNRKQNKLIKEIYSLTEEQRNSYLKNGGNVNMSQKEVQENERHAELRRRKLSELRELEASIRGTKKQAYEFGNGKGAGEGFYISPMASNSFGEEPKTTGTDFKQSNGNNKKIRLSSPEEF